MTKYVLYHAKEYMMRDSRFYREDGSIFNKAQALEAFRDHEYNKVHEFDLIDSVDCGGLDVIYAESQNIDKPWLNIGTRSTSVGDIIVVNDESIYIVGSFGFDKLS